MRAQSAKLGTYNDVVMPPRKYRILVVDDDSAVLTTYRMILEQKGYEVVGAASAREAIGILENSKLDLLLCDLSLEDEASGFVVIEQASRLQPGLPSLLLTGYIGQDISDRARSLGISVLSKPIGIQEFLAAIRAHLENAAPKANAAPGI
jgi:DNA-binding NtrC family response regulator